MKARTLKDEISAYNKLCEEGLELDHFGKWIIIYEGELNGVFDTEDEAILEAVKKFRDRVFLILQVGAPESLYRSGLPTVLSADPTIKFESAQCQQNLPK